MTTAHIVYFATIFLCILLLIWWRTGCEWDKFSDVKFPTRGHSLLIIIASIVPILNICLLVGLIIIYIVNRTEDELHLKKNKFNKFWFDVED